MDPKSAVDVYFDFIETSWVILRKKDDMVLRFKGPMDARTIGHAAFEGLVPKTTNSLPWKKAGKDLGVHWESVHVVVVWRDSQKTVISTPLCSWGKAPDIRLIQKPPYPKLGNAVLEQLKYSAKMKGLGSPGDGRK